MHISINIKKKKYCYSLYVKMTRNNDNIHHLKRKQCRHVYGAEVCQNQSFIIKSKDQITFKCILTII